MVSDNVKWLFKLIPYEGNKVEDTVEAMDLVEAISIVDKTYPFELYEEFSIRKLVR